MIKIACQGIVYGNMNLFDDIENILGSMAEIGYDGAELGGRFLDPDEPDFYAALLESAGLALPAIHVGGDFLDRDSVDSQLEEIGETIELARQLGCRYIYLSGDYREGKADEDYLHEAQLYSEIGAQCAEAGLVLCYHNHDWEIANDFHGLNLLLDNIDADLMKLVPDIGWIKVAGADPVAFMEKHGDRVEALHFKDFKHDGTPRAFTELGTGITDFRAVFGFVKDRPGEFWITAEQDETDKTPAESAAMNYRFIRDLAG
ncbi:MAG: sugar phosphate isomerase/epimerase [Oscillospiraceae bacterium]|nr:sugar phosphate isomerase/epimerase [Oscillospiraceae bacterium]